MHHCHLHEGQIGACRARRNENGRSVCINYGKITSIALDPIEKKPLARFYPGSMILSVGSFGCNLNCPFCQNDSISMACESEVRTEYLSPKRLAQLSEDFIPDGNIGVAYTYNEPMVGYEYVRDAAREVNSRGMKNVVVTNGSALPKALNEVLPYIDAFNIDLKGFTEKYYKKLGGDLSTVLDFIKIAHEKAHVELTALIVPGENDSPEEMRLLSGWVASVDPGIPLHITRFFPRRHMLDKLPTDIASMQILAETASEKLSDVMLGNV